MPELPEVETTCRGIRPHVQGRSLSRLVVRNPRLRVVVAADLPARIEGARLDAVERRAKYLLLRHCFEDLGFGRVKLQTDALNTRSAAAIAKLGATREGVLRRRPGGRISKSCRTPAWRCTP